MARSSRPQSAGGPTVGRRNIEPWVRDFNARRQALNEAINIPAGSWVKTNLNVDSPGLRRRSPFCSRNERSQSQSPRVSPQTPEGLNTIVADLQAGGNEFAVRYEKESHAVPAARTLKMPRPRSSSWRWTHNSRLR